MSFYDIVTKAVPMPMIILGIAGLIFLVSLLTSIFNSKSSIFNTIVKQRKRHTTAAVFTPSMQEGFDGTAVNTDPGPATVIPKPFKGTSSEQPGQPGQPIKEGFQEGCTSMGIPGNQAADYLGPFRAGGAGTPGPNFDDAPYTEGRRFDETPLDKYYDEYERAEVEAEIAEKEAIASQQKLNIQEDELLDVGSRFSATDVDINNIPWDSDNVDSLTKDVLWGFVTQEASKSLFLKVYSQLALSTPEAIQDLDPKNDASPPAVNLPLLDVSVGGGADLENFVSESFGGIIGGLGNQINPLQKMIDPPYDSFFGKNKKNKLDFKNSNAFTRAADALDDTRRQVSKILDKIDTVLSKLSNKKIKGPFKKLKSLFKAVEKKIRKMFMEKLKKFMMKKMIKQIIMQVFMKSTAAGLTAASVASFGAASPALAAWIILCIIVDVMLIAVDIISQVASIILPPILEKYLEGEGICPPGSETIKAIIPDKTAYFFFTTFIPLADLVDLMGPYVCWDGGDAKLKQRIFTPTYVNDKTLSLVYHKWTDAMTTRARFEEYADDALKKGACPDGFQLINGICYQGCPPGTRAASATDMMCHQIVLPRTRQEPSYRLCNDMRPADKLDRNWVEDGVTRNCIEPWTQASINCQIESDTIYNVELQGFRKLVCSGSGTRGCGCVVVPHTQRARCDNGFDLDPNDYKCYRRCDSGFEGRGLNCFSTTPSQARNIRSLQDSGLVVENGYILPRTLGELKVDSLGSRVNWCNFASPVMLDRMAQFYYEYSYLNPEILEVDVAAMKGGDTPENRKLVDLSGGPVLIQWDYISRFFGVIASSELSCDVVCEIRTITYNPITGASFKMEIGCSNDGDNPAAADEYTRTNPRCYRRFYFMKKQGDPQGVFTVTGCTNSDGTAPDAESNSWDPGAEYIPSLPKSYMQKECRTPVKWTTQDWLNAGISVGTGVLSAGVGLGLGAAAGRAQALGVSELKAQTASIVASTLFSSSANLAASKLQGVVGEAPPDDTEGPDTFIRKLEENGKELFHVITKGAYVTQENNKAFFEIDQGPVVEQTVGIVPLVDRCANARLNDTVCSHKLVLRDTIREYERLNPTKRVKQIDIIEPRGQTRDLQGCYYRWKEVNYDAATNKEDTNFMNKEIVYKYRINNFNTCVFDPERIITDVKENEFPIKTLNINGTNFYPTRRKITKPVRFIKISGGKDYLQISQIVVMNTDLYNVSKGKSTTKNTTDPFYEFNTYAEPKFATDGNELARSMPTIYCSKIPGGVFELDLGKEEFIHSITLYNRRDIGSTTEITNQLFDRDSNRWSGYKLECLDAAQVVNYSFNLTPPTRTGELYNYINNFVDFPPIDLQRRRPYNSFAVPLALPPETSLGGAACPNSKCSDKATVETLVEAFNQANPATKIIKVLKVWTPRPNRCDFEVEMMRIGTDGVKTFAKETTYIDVANNGNCTFRRTADGAALVNSGQSIQFNTPDLVYTTVAGVNTKGLGVYEKITGTVRQKWGEMTQVLQTRKPLPTLREEAAKVEKQTAETLAYIAANQTLQGCPTKCSDASVLTAIFNRYNTDRGALKEQFGAERSTMKRILRAAGGSATECDLLFEEQYEYFEDTLYPPTEQQVRPKAVRVKMENIGGCTWRVAAGADAIKDVSGAAVGLLADTSSLPRFIRISGKGAYFTPESIEVYRKGTGATASQRVKVDISPSVISGSGVLRYEPHGYTAEEQNRISKQIGGVTAKGVCEGVPGRIYVDGSKVVPFGCGGNLTCCRPIPNPINPNLIYYHSDSNTAPFVEIDLKEGLDLDSIVINNPVAFRDRMKFFKMQVLNASRVELWSAQLTDQVKQEYKITAKNSSSAGSLAQPFSAPRCEVDCRSAANLAAIKARLNAAGTVGNRTTNFRQVTESFRNGSSVCEYKMIKDQTMVDPFTKRASTTSDIETYVRATFNANTAYECDHYSDEENARIRAGESHQSVCESVPGNILSGGDQTKAPGCPCHCCKPAACGFALQAVEDFPVEDIEETTNMQTGDTEYYIGKKLIVPPLLFNYVPGTDGASRLVDTTPITI